MRAYKFGNPKSGRDRLQELFIAKFKSKFERGFTKESYDFIGRI